MDPAQECPKLPEESSLHGGEGPGGEPPRTVAADLGVSERTVYKWLRRYREEGELEASLGN